MTALLGVGLALEDMKADALESGEARPWIHSGESPFFLHELAKYPIQQVS